MNYDQLILKQVNEITSCRDLKSCPWRKSKREKEILDGKSIVVTREAAHYVTHLIDQYKLAVKDKEFKSIGSFQRYSASEIKDWIGDLDRAKRSLAQRIIPKLKLLSPVVFHRNGPTEILRLPNSAQAEGVEKGIVEFIAALDELKAAVARYPELYRWVSKEGDGLVNELTLQLVTLFEVTTGEPHYPIVAKLLETATEDDSNDREVIRQRILRLRKSQTWSPFYHTYRKAFMILFPKIRRVRRPL